VPFQRFEDHTFRRDFDADSRRQTSLATAAPSTPVVEAVNWQERQRLLLAGQRELGG
jgi:hypothetical protein